MVAPIAAESLIATDLLHLLERPDIGRERRELRPVLEACDEVRPALWGASIRGKRRRDVYRHGLAGARRRRSARPVDRIAHKTSVREHRRRLVDRNRMGDEM